MIRLIKLEIVNVQWSRKERENFEISQSDDWWILQKNLKEFVILHAKLSNYVLKWSSLREVNQTDILLMKSGSIFQG